jgi:hypothetical protein
MIRLFDIRKNDQMVRRRNKIITYNLRMEKVKKLSLLKSIGIMAACIVFLAGLIFTASCRSKISEKKLLEGVEFHLGAPGGEGDADKAREKLINMIKDADSEIGFVLNNFDDEKVAGEMVKKIGDEFTIIGSGDRARTGDSGFTTLADNGVEIAKNTIGVVEENFFTFDHSQCWLSTGGASELTFNNSFAMFFIIKSDILCHHFYAEARQMGLGKQFSDTGEPSFGKFEHEKTKTMNVNRFYLDDFIIHLYFGAQERPLSFLFDRLLSARKSIYFMAQALTQNFVKTPVDLVHSINRSHVLNILQYKAKIPQLYGGDFILEGMLDDELMGGNDNCGNPPDYDLDYPVSIHCGLVKAMGKNIKKYVGVEPLGVNMFLIDYETDTPMLIVMSSDFRLVEGYDLTDGFLMSFERIGYQSDRTLFDKAYKMIKYGISLGRLLVPEVEFATDSSFGDEGNSATLELTISPADKADIILNYSFKPGTATGAGSDYDDTTTSILIAAGSTTAAISVPVTDDSLDEQNEDFEVTIKGREGYIRGSTVTHKYTINDND